jgi:GNAT superfamily N-acetyltransferase
MALLMQRECGYDFALFHGGDKSLERPTAYLACWQGWAIAIGVINVRPRWGYWHIRNEKDAIPLDQIAPIVSLTGIFVCANYRGKGVAEFLIREIAKIEDVTIEEMAYELPFSESGKKLILSIIPEDKLRVC